MTSGQTQLSCSNKRHYKMIKQLEAFPELTKHQTYMQLKALHTSWSWPGNVYSDRSLCINYLNNWNDPHSTYINLGFNFCAHENLKSTLGLLFSLSFSIFGILSLEFIQTTFEMILQRRIAAWNLFSSDKILRPAMIRSIKSCRNLATLYIIRSTDVRTITHELTWRIRSHWTKLSGLWSVFCLRANFRQTDAPCTRVVGNANRMSNCSIVIARLEC